MYWAQLLSSGSPASQRGAKHKTSGHWALPLARCSTPSNSLFTAESSAMNPRPKLGQCAVACPPWLDPERVAEGYRLASYSYYYRTWGKILFSLENVLYIATRGTSHAPVICPPVEYHQQIYCQAIMEAKSRSGAGTLKLLPHCDSQPAGSPCKCAFLETEDGHQGMRQRGDGKDRAQRDVLTFQFHRVCQSSFSIFLVSRLLYIWLLRTSNRVWFFELLSMNTILEIQNEEL